MAGKRNKQVSGRARTKTHRASSRKPGGSRLRMRGVDLQPESPRTRARLWAPWRMDYIKGHATNGPAFQGCVLCELLRMDDGDGNLVLCRTGNAYVVMNRYPYTNGHLMVVPRRHTSDFTSLTAEETAGLMELIQKSVAALQQSIRAQGFNVGMNIGRIAGAGIDEHLHFHVVPRWNGDTNFMPVLADVNLVNDHLVPSYRLIRETMKKLG